MVAGNIGLPVLDALAMPAPDVYVLELSSFQLDAAGSFEPTAAVVLNVTQDHLDWHGSMQAYAGAKARIFGQRGMMVLNREDPQVMAMAQQNPQQAQQMMQQAHLSTVEGQYVSMGWLSHSSNRLSCAQLPNRMHSASHS